MTQDTSVKDENGKRTMRSTMEFRLEGKVLDVDKEGTATLECRLTKCALTLKAPDKVRKIDLLEEFKRPMPPPVQDRRRRVLSEMMSGPFKMRIDKFFAARVKGEDDFWRLLSGGRMSQVALPPKPLRVGESFVRRFDKMVGGEGAFSMATALTLETATDKSASWSLSLQSFKMSVQTEDMKMDCKIPRYSGRMRWDAEKQLLKTAIQMTTVMTMTMKMMNAQIETTSVMDADITCKITPAK